MVGISGFAGEQWRAAAQGHPALKAIFPYDACSAYGGMFGFRDFNPGGMLHSFPYLLDVFSTVHESRDRPAELPAAEEDLWLRAMRNPDYKQYINLYNILTQKGQRTFIMYLMMTHPWESEGTAERAEETFKKIRIPFYTGSGAYAYTYKLHWLGAQHYFQNVDAPKKLIFTGPAHLDRPFHQYHGEIIRWYDHWLKGHDTGIMDESPVRYWLMGANEWRTGTDWPLPETQWTKYYLSHWETLSTEPPRPASELGAAAREGERDVPSSLPERELTRGWLKASYRALDEKRSKPWEPFHRLTKDAIAPVKSGEVVEYQIQILATANQFKAGHRICLDITSMDVPTGTGAMTNVEYIPYHVCSSKTVTHRVYRDAERPSHLLLPIIPRPTDQRPA